MNTTEIHIEHFMSGVLSLMFIVILGAACLPVQTDALQFFLGHETFTAIIAMSVTYPLGIFCDNLADKLLGHYEASLKRKAHCQGKSIRALIVKMNIDFVSDYFNYNRVRIRIARSTWLNFVLIGLAIVVFVILKMDYLKTHDGVAASLFFLAISILIAVYAFINWRWLTIQNFDTLNKWHDQYMVTKP